jgi:hypothetical protein
VTLSMSKKPGVNAADVAESVIAAPKRCAAR